jgi:hypothetical protein
MGGRWALTTLRWQAFFATWCEYQLSAEFHASEQILTTCQTHTAAAMVLLIQHQPVPCAARRRALVEHITLPP